MDKLSASEAAYGFAGWLTSRPEEVTMSGHHDAAIVAELVSEFCDANDLAPPRDGIWPGNLVHPSATALAASGMEDVDA